MLTGARYWQQLGAPSSAVITTIWSRASPEWTLRSTIRHAAKLTVMGDYFRPYKGDYRLMAAPPIARHKPKAAQIAPS